MVQIDVDYVVVDNMWLWRVDKDRSGQVPNSQNKVHNGLFVNSNDVTIYGLSVEYTNFQ